MACANGKAVFGAAVTLTVLLAGGAPALALQVVVQAPADQRAAQQADADRRAAERADRTRRQQQNQRDMAEAEELARAMDEGREQMRQEIEQQNREEMAEWERVEQNRHAACMITLDDEKQMMIETIRRQYDGVIAQSRDAEAIAGLRRARDAAIAGLTQGECQSAGEARFAYERQAQIEAMQRAMQERGTTEMPAFVRRSDGSIGPANK